MTGAEAGGRGAEGAAPAAPSACAAFAWLDDRVVPADALPPAPEGGPCCHTTARYAAGRVWLGARHAARLVRDAAALGLGAADAGHAERALLRLGRACFGGRAGVVRLEARPGEAGPPLLVGTARALGPEPDTWRAVTSPEIHPGPGRAPGAKRARDVYRRARAALASADADEALLFDAGGRLVEGSRTALVVVAPEGTARTPPLALGGVASLAREVLLEGGAPIEEEMVRRDELLRAEEIVALNAVRGARPVVAVDGAPVGRGRTGPVAARLGALLAAAE